MDAYVMNIDEMQQPNQYLLS